MMHNYFGTQYFDGSSNSRSVGFDKLVFINGGKYNSNIDNCLDIH